MRSLIAAALCLSGLVASTGVVSAHAQYQSSTPPANGTVSAAPGSVQVTWTEELSALQFTVTGPDGSNVVAGPAAIDLAQRHNGSVPIKSAGPGQYVVLWHTVSGDDGDPNDGTFVFTVAGTPATTPAAAPTPAPANPTVAAAKPAASAPACVDNGQVTPGQADFRVNTYCKRQAIRDQYKGQIDEKVFNFDLSIGMGLESSLKDAMGAAD
jgi:methionine-rich copper-binding protein CopC